MTYGLPLESRPTTKLVIWLWENRSIQRLSVVHITSWPQQQIFLKSEIAMLVVAILWNIAKRKTMAAIRKNDIFVS